MILSAGSLLSRLRVCSSEVERPAHNRMVAGSKPARPTTKEKRMNFLKETIQAIKDNGHKIMANAAKKLRQKPQGDLHDWHNSENSRQNCHNKTLCIDETSGLTNRQVTFLRDRIRKINGDERD